MLVEKTNLEAAAAAVEVIMKRNMYICLLCLFCVCSERDFQRIVVLPKNEEPISLSVF